ncbi:hypothetical protein, partial [Desulfosporosinus nitroreducens]|uniref:hypothetical protein n=1 Tax=Desulfosporosinus nitroreducens TaxID=2018668 RepID=UPI00207D4EAA
YSRIFIITFPEGQSRLFLFLVKRRGNMADQLDITLSFRVMGIQIEVLLKRKYRGIVEYSYTKDFLGFRSLTD